jgi:hypothetical protein
MSSKILNFCCLLVFHGFHQTIMQFLLSGMQNTFRRIHFSNGAANKVGLQFKFSMIYAFTCCQILFQRLLVYKFEVEFQLPRRIPGDISMHYSHSLPYISHIIF